MGFSKTCPPALNRKIVEIDLVNEHHWLPQDIAKIPYKWLQFYYAIRRQRTEANYQKPQLDAKKAEGQAKTSDSRGQQKRFTKVTKLTP